MKYFNHSKINKKIEEAIYELEGSKETVSCDRKVHLF